MVILRGDTVGLDVLHRLLESSDSTFRARSAFLLGQVSSTESVSYLTKHLKDRSSDVRNHSGIALAEMGYAQGIPACASVLNNGPSWLRYYAVYGLWQVHTPQARRILEAHAADKDKLVGDTIRAALKTKPTVLPTVKRRPHGPTSPKVPAGQVWNEAKGIFLTETDWWWHSGNYPQAVRCLEVVVFLDPEYIEGYSSIAWLQWSLGYGNTAIQTLKRGIAADPKSPDAWYELGLHYYRIKNYKLAEGPLRKSVELGGDMFAHRFYAHCLEKVGKLNEAVEQWQIIIRNDPKDDTAKINMERVKKRLNVERPKKNSKH